MKLQQDRSGGTVTLVYRAVWDDYSCEPVGVLDDEFRSWAASKDVEPDDIPRRGGSRSVAPTPKLVGRCNGSRAVRA